MSNSVNIDELLTAVDQATRPFRTLQAANVSLSDGIKETEKTLRGLYSQVAQIDSFTKAQHALSDVSEQLKAAKTHTRSLANEMRNADAPTRAQANALARARESVSKLTQQHDALRQSVKNQRQSLSQAGISTRAPATARNRLQSRISESSAQLTGQREALRLENRQARVAKIQQTKESVVALGEKVSAVGNFSMSIARSGVDLGKKLLGPGYEQSLKNDAPVSAAPAGSASTAVASVSTSGVSAQAGNLGSDLAALQAAYQSLSVDLFSQQESSLRKLVQIATEYLGKVQQWVQNNQGLVQTFGLIATVVTVVAGAIGTVAGVIAPVFTGISTLITLVTTFGGVFTTVGGAIVGVIGGLTLPIVAAVAGFAAAAVAIYALWEPIKAFFAGVVEGINIAFAPIAELFAPFQPVFDSIGQALSRVKEFFIGLIGPITYTQETLATCGEAGKFFGQVLATALMAPLKGLQLLRDGVSWVLEKLGIINKQSAIDLPKPQVEPGAGGAMFGAISPGNIQNYQAVKPASGGSYVDQSKTDINITLQGDVTPGSDNSRHLQALLEQHETQRRNNALSQFNSVGGFAS
ncbi:hypothetical protein [Vagococcus sp. WN89Y]|uniref:hypothetical protein n=1 Tax=Vagococcus sp. WN89Y TaxID=3457258 RepID=UPI003FCD5397